MPRRHDAVSLSGWLFADLLLGLAVIFLVANTSGIKPAPVLPPTLIITPTILNANANTSDCTGGTSAPECMVTIEAAQTSTGTIAWTVSSEMGDAIRYSPRSGELSPGQKMSMSISDIPCHNGSFTFSGQRVNDKTAAQPVIVSWRCIPPVVEPERLDLKYQSFTLKIKDINAFLNSSSQDSDIKQQVKDTALLQGKRVGIAIVYGGAPDTGFIEQAKRISGKVYRLLGDINQGDFHVFGQSAFYEELYTLGVSQSVVQVDVYFFA